MPANLIIIFIMDKKSKDELTQLGLESYYQGLGRGERGKLLLYVAQDLGISYPSVHGKFRGSQRFSVAELRALEPIINQELWRK